MAVIRVTVRRPYVASLQSGPGGVYVAGCTSTLLASLSETRVTPRIGSGVSEGTPRRTARPQPVGRVSLTSTHDATPVSSSSNQNVTGSPAQTVNCAEPLVAIIASEPCATKRASSGWLVGSGGSGGGGDAG